MKAFVTGCAGFIGSHLVDYLLFDGHEITGYDIAPCFPSGIQRAIHGDILDLNSVSTAMNGCDIAFHLAAHADIRHNLANPERVSQPNIEGTMRVLRGADMAGVRRFVFISSCAVYGDNPPLPTPENCPMPVQTSIYAASKLAGETLVSSFAEAGAFDEAYIFRLVSVLGPRYHHGHVIDFWRQLCKDPSRLTVLNDGHSRKSYIDVSDVISGIMTAVNSGVAAKSPHRTAIFNVGTNATLSIRESAAIIASAMQVSPKMEFGSAPKGWVGDPLIVQPDCSKLRALGWRPKYHPEMAVRRTLRWLEENESP